ncbi:VanZ family protein [Bacillus sp. DJP31]|uniref:VanZ family protein n=1 Tax=Bacillus sp. DJP31 TaxID=3409789 RepID=UPI003BB54535
MQLYLINGSTIIFFGVISYILGRGISLAINFSRNSPLSWFKETVRFLFISYILMVVSVTLFPLALWIDFNVESIKRGLNLIPIVSIVKDIKLIGIAYDGDVAFMIGLILRNVGGNILLLMPLGVLAPLLSDKFIGIKNTLLLGLLTSISIETIQFLELLAGGRVRTVDVDDVICNVIGTCIGYLIYNVTQIVGYKYQLKDLRIKSKEMFIRRG